MIKLSIVALCLVLALLAPKSSADDCDYATRALLNRPAIFSQWQAYNATISSCLVKSIQAGPPPTTTSSSEDLKMVTVHCEDTKIYDACVAAGGYYAQVQLSFDTNTVYYWQLQTSACTPVSGCGAGSVDLPFFLNWQIPVAQPAFPASVHAINTGWGSTTFYSPPRKQAKLARVQISQS